MKETMERGKEHRSFATKCSINDLTQTKYKWHIYRVRKKSTRVKKGKKKIKARGE
jgi:hypothetical protein